MNKNFNRKKQKMQDKDDLNCSITWTIGNPRVKNYPILIRYEGDEYFGYMNEDDVSVGRASNYKVLYDDVVKDFNILESEKPYLAKCMHDFSVKDLCTLDTNSDFAKFLAKYNFELHVQFDED